MHLSFTEKKNIRKNFGRLKETLSIPNLIEVQKQSYAQFLSSEKDDLLSIKGMGEKTLLKIEETIKNSLSS